MPAERPPKRRELAAMLRAARMVDRERKSLSGQRLAVVGLAATLLAAAVSSQKSAGIPHGFEPRPFLSSHRPVTGSNEEFRMRTSMSRSAAVFSSLAMSASAAAQTAVQWRVEDGGNGHWYAVTSESLVHPALRQACESHGGHLATLTSQQEWQWVKTHIQVAGLFVGAYQDHASPSYAEPNGGWRWVTDEPFVLDIAYMGTTHIFCTMTAPGFDDCPAGTCGYCGCGTPGAQDALFFTGCCNNILDDVGDGVTQNCDSIARAGVIEWSADCNGDGMVDYGQIRAGEFADANANNIPDACEACGVDWTPGGDSLPVPTQADNWYGAGAQYLDANGDGIQDVVFACRPLQARLGLGGGHFGPVIVSEPLGWFGGYCVADLNGDSFDDFVSYDYFAGRDRVMLSLGDGRFAQSQALVTGNYAAPCRAGDMDGDGDLDIVAGTEVEGYLRIFRNDGHGVFDGGVTIGSMGTYHREMELADLDGDGDLDIVVQNEWIYQTIRILRNDGNMSFAPVATLPYPGGQLNMVPIDYDRDGDLDLVASTILGDVRVYRKEPKGFNYTAVILGNFSNRSLSLDLNDFDHDGLKDLFVGDNNRFGFMRARSIGGFEPPVWVPVPNKDRFVLVDLNNDSEMDVATGKQTPESLGSIDFLLQTCAMLMVPRDYPTIQSAIDAVPMGLRRTVQVAAGTYNESFSLNGKDVVIRGAAGNATILDGTGLPASIATLTGGEPVTAGLENLVFRNGTVGSRFTPQSTFTVGGAVFARDSAAFIRNCRFELCRADYGGAIYQLYGRVSWQNCVFTGNIANYDGGAGQIYNCSGVVEQSAFTGNRCGMNGPGSGSAFKAIGADGVGELVILQACSITGNTAGDSGSAVEFYQHVKFQPGILQIVDSVIESNTSGEPIANGAGGLRVLGSQDCCLLSGSTRICGNSARNVSGPYLSQGGATVCDCQADLSGDGVVNGGDLGLLLSAWGPAQPTGAGDVNHDGQVDGADLSIMLGSWGACP